MKSLDDLKRECTERKDELRPVVEEHARLSAVLVELERIMKAPVKITATVPRPQGGRPKRVAS